MYPSIDVVIPARTLAISNPSVERNERYLYRLRDESKLIADRQRGDPHACFVARVGAPRHQPQAPAWDDDRF
jgi:hypothetical protein